MTPHPPAPNIYYIYLYAPRRVKKRVRVIPGTDAEVQTALGCVIVPENLPLPMGDIALDFAGWLAERARNEG